MPYSISTLGKLLFPPAVLLLSAISAQATPSAKNYFDSPFPAPHNSGSYTLYKRDTIQEHSAPGFVHRAANGDLVITVPPTAAGRYKIRFFDERKTLLFEIRQIRDPLLIVERYNFEHAGQFHYELYRDNSLVEKTNFMIRKE